MVFSCVAASFRDCCVIPRLLLYSRLGWLLRRWLLRRWLLDQTHIEGAGWEGSCARLDGTTNRRPDRGGEFMAWGVHCLGSLWFGEFMVWGVHGLEVHRLFGVGFILLETDSLPPEGCLGGFMAGVVFFLAP